MTFRRRRPRLSNIDLRSASCVAHDDLHNDNYVKKKITRKKLSIRMKFSNLCAPLCILIFQPFINISNYIQFGMTASASKPSLSSSIARQIYPMTTKATSLRFPFHIRHNKGSTTCTRSAGTAIATKTTGSSTNKRHDVAVKNCSTATLKKKDLSNINLENAWIGSGFYYGIGEEFLKSRSTAVTPIDKNGHTINNKSSKTIGPMEEENEEESISDYSSTKQSDRVNKRKAPHDHLPADSEAIPSNDYVDKHYDDYDETEPSLEIFSTLFRETFQEFRKATDGIREDLDLLKQEIIELQKLQRRYSEQQQQYDDDDDDEQYNKQPSAAAPTLKKKRVAMYDKLAIQIENWGKQLLREEGGEEHGWKAIECNKLLRSKYNPDGETKVFLKWMSDPREEQLRQSEGNDGVNKDKDVLFPCLKCYGTLDAPIETVCKYLADETRVSEYNDLVVDFRDLEEISHNSKVTWSLCPQILFIKPRDFVTFCSHRWKRDGTQVVVNQALEHHANAPEAVAKEGEGGACRARALRGLNLISPDPDDPLTKTRFTLLALADPGGGLPQWAVKAAINTVAPIEPFKLYYKLRHALKDFEPTSESELVSSSSLGTTGRSSKPAGLAQLGYACFWPQGEGF